jgi:hypothetical protein
MTIEIAELTISCMKYQETYTIFKEKYIKKETTHSVTPQGEETLTLTVDTEDEEEEEVWAKAEEK